METIKQIFDAVIAANVPYAIHTGTVNGHAVEARIIPQCRVTTSRKAAPRIEWSVAGKRVSKENLQTICEKPATL